MKRKYDSRFTLTPEREEELHQDIADDILTRKEIQEKFEVSKSKVWQLCNPDQHLKNYEARKKFQKGRYYNKDHRRVCQQRYRQKLKDIDEAESKEG